MRWPRQRRIASRSSSVSRSDGPTASASPSIANPMPRLSKSIANLTAANGNAKPDRRMTNSEALTLIAQLPLNLALNRAYGIRPGNIGGICEFQSGFRLVTVPHRNRGFRAVNIGAFPFARLDRQV